MCREGSSFRSAVLDERLDAVSIREFGKYGSEFFEVGFTHTRTFARLCIFISSMYLSLEIILYARIRPRVVTVT